MAAQFSTVIHGIPTALSSDGLTDVVKSISWSRLAQQEVEIDGETKTFTAGHPGVTQLAAPNPASFIPYDQLTEAQIIEWIDSVIVDWSSIDNRLAQNLQNQINPPVVNLPLPWQQQ